MGDTPVPVLWTAAPAATLDFYRTLGYTVTYEQTRPYVYLAFERNGCPIHFSGAPETAESIIEHVGCLVMVDNVADVHREFSTALRAHFGKIPAKGRPRITRFRPGQSRFSVVDPDGNTLIFIQRDEPEDVEYGGSAELEDLARVLDNARILRDFKNDDKAAARVLEVGLGRFATVATPLERARAMAMLAELAVATDEPRRAEKFRADIRALELSAEDRDAVTEELRAGTDLEHWLDGDD
ncbi:VOC family protein [Nocardia noduli]|uniref:VOC family protein n=1 Tax=Nocardia noduli TaxID=2815722 RepID=UPI001C227C17|nr:VOC family protein [Nocardia noduli]